MKPTNFLLALLVVLFGACAQTETVTITILHTNDTHSQVEPNDNNNGGYARRMGYIQQERAKDPELILLDAGDFVQGTPYFNYYHGRVEADALNWMKYDAGTLGNHEFDFGVALLDSIVDRLNHPILCCNYDFSESLLNGKILPDTIIERKGVRIGIIGVCHIPDQLIDKKNNFEPIKYLEPAPIVDSLATALKEKENCELVICLSHLGPHLDKTAATTMCDSALIAQTRNVDIVISAHNHEEIVGQTFKNKDGKDVYVSETSYQGRYVGKFEIQVERPKKNK